MYAAVGIELLTVECRLGYLPPVSFVPLAKDFWLLFKKVLIIIRSCNGTYILSHFVLSLVIRNGDIHPFGCSRRFGSPILCRG